MHTLEIAGLMIMNKTTPRIFLVGPSGAGKTTVGHVLSKKIKRSFYDTDQYITEKTGVSISWIFDIEGEQGFRKREVKAIEELINLSNIIVATGGGTVQTESSRHLLRKHGLVIYLKTAIDQQQQRIHDRDHRPLLQVNDLPKQLNHLAHQRTPLYEDIADKVFVTDGRTVHAVVDDIIAYLAE